MVARQAWFNSLPVALEIAVVAAARESNAAGLTCEGASQVVAAKGSGDIEVFATPTKDGEASARAVAYASTAGRRVAGSGPHLLSQQRLQRRLVDALVSGGAVERGGVHLRRRACGALRQALCRRVLAEVAGGARGGARVAVCAGRALHAAGLAGAGLIRASRARHASALAGRRLLVCARRTRRAVRRLAAGGTFGDAAG